MLHKVDYWHEKIYMCKNYKILNFSLGDFTEHQYLLGLLNTTKSRVFHLSEPLLSSWDTEKCILSVTWRLQGDKPGNKWWHSIRSWFWSLFRWRFTGRLQRRVVWRRFRFWRWWLLHELVQSHLLQLPIHTTAHLIISNVDCQPSRPACNKFNTASSMYCMWWEQQWNSAKFSHCSSGHPYQHSEHLHLPSITKGQFNWAEVNRTTA